MRVFFALWPDESVRGSLEEISKKLHGACGGKKTGRDSIHLTLVFVGEVDAARIGSLREAALKTAGKAFEIKIDLVAYWKHNRIAWVGMSEVPRALSDLVSSLQQRLKEEGFVFDERNYLPHITLLRKAQKPETLPGFEPFSWKATEFCLVASAPSDYVVLERWPLQVDAAFEVPG